MLYVNQLSNYNFVQAGSQIHYALNFNSALPLSHMPAFPRSGQLVDQDIFLSSSGDSFMMPPI